MIFIGDVWSAEGENRASKTTHHVRATCPRTEKSLLPNSQQKLAVLYVAPLAREPLSLLESSRESRFEGKKYCVLNIAQ